MLTSGLASVKREAIESSDIRSGWFSRRFKTNDPLARYVNQVRNFGVALFLGGGFCILTFMGWVIATDGSPLIHGVPSFLIPFTLLGLAAWLVRVLPPSWSRAERRAARQLGVRAFAVGLFPATRTYMVVGGSGVVFITGEVEAPVTVAWSQIDIAALKVSEFGVGLSLSSNGAWFDIPIVLEAGGPVASAWAYSPYGAKQALLHAVESCLEPHVPIYRVGIRDTVA